MNGIPLLDLDLCRARQQRLLSRLAAAPGGAPDLVVLTSPEHVQYLTGHRWDYRWARAPLVAIDSQARVLLVCPDREVELAAADDLRVYQSKWRSTLRLDQRQASAALLGDWLLSRGPRSKVAVEFSACCPHVTRLFPDASLVDVDPVLWDLRRRKDADELALLRRAIDATGAMYRTARAMIEPGVSELAVFSSLQAAAVESCGEMITDTGNDYASGVRGGAPRPRGARAGELYILDLGPAYRGYFADNARTLSVDRRPTDAQYQAWKRVCGAFAIVERMGRPGVRCQDIYAAVHDWLNATPKLGAWDSHLGHGIGLFVHETPHLNPSWDDVLAEGDVIAVEPALYGPDLEVGIRIENDYLVTASGLELLSPFPLSLVED
ncbi:MAG: aminopeptidase P family protein [Planctomycetota bacterium]|nr:MAG: aminopeptidase P family protein [Planctomycetota bacterium]